ncbi:MAG TPA: TadE/TadG family type IV pilus assembly protein [Allosphingosinicella sp.]|nr:TadE/TadG family type IV pilus assembly protein [Allosphingosinicella sp.]
MFGFGRRKAANSRRGGGFLSRLARDSRGNTLAIVGAALIPLAAMIGSGVDMSRAYMAKTRLQMACDAAALAGRRVMQNDQMSSEVTTEATRFFNYNFNQGQYGTAAFTPAVSRPSSGTVRVSASTTIPTTVMKMFGFTSLPLSVTCDAQLSFVNTDVMLVLDVTGSMDQFIDGTKKIVSLREAVMALYDELSPIQTQLEANGMRLRYGIVPYSTTVNVGALIRAVNSDYLVNTMTYNSRVANFDRQVAEYTSTPQPPEAPVTQTFGSSISQSNCDRYGRNVSFSGFTPSATAGGGPPPAATWTRTYSNNESAGVDWGWSGASDTSGDNRSCRRRYVETDTTYVVSGYHYESSGWIYQEEPLDVSQYKMGNTISYATSIPRHDQSGSAEAETGGTYDMIEAVANNVSGISTTNITWNGCIQERDTVNTITASSGYTIPADAYDLNINLIPHNDATRWRPMLPQLYWRADNHANIGSAPCPWASQRLTAMNRGQMESYVQMLTPTGNTYHDIGMIWGARLLSNQGIFSADNPDTFNGMPVSRHIIFMTDGEMDTENDLMAFQGVEGDEHRIGGTPTPSDNDTGLSNPSSMESRHVQRMRMVCNAAKAQGFSIWVIAFGTALQPHLLECASNANQASVASNRTQLIERFREIGSNIGALRLTQ